MPSRKPLYESLPGRHGTPRVHVCFYANEEEPFGEYIGEVEFIIGRQASRNLGNLRYKDWCRRLLTWDIGVSLVVRILPADTSDAALLVLFMLFIFLGIPITCAVAISFHVYKHRQ